MTKVDPPPLPATFSRQMRAVAEGMISRSRVRAAFASGAVFGQHLVDQHGVGAELPDIGVLVVVGVFRRGDHQADHQRGQGREKAGAEADGFLGTSLEQVGRQGPLQDHADGRADQDRGEGSQKRGGRTHGVITLSWCRRLGHGGIAYRGVRAWATRDDLLRRNSSGGNVAKSNRTLDHRYPPCVRCAHDPNPAFPVHNCDIGAFAGGGAAVHEIRGGRGHAGRELRQGHR